MGLLKKGVSITTTTTTSSDDDDSVRNGNTTTLSSLPTIRRSKKVPYHLHRVVKVVGALILVLVGSYQWLLVQSSSLASSSSTANGGAASSSTRGTSRGGKDNVSLGSSYGPWGKLCHAAVDRLLELNIQLIALDFDMTIVDVHTGGSWSSSSHKLAKHVRPEMHCLMVESVQRGIRIAVASFSVQEDLIQEVLQLAIPTVMMGTTTTVPIHGGRNVAEHSGKRKQLSQVLEDINEIPSTSHKNGRLSPRRQDGERTSKNDSVVVGPSTTILIDDDEHNIHMAKKDGYFAVWFDPDHVDAIFESILSVTNV